jgi:hypothetical protein
LLTEVESGKHSDRPQLRATQAACKKHKGQAGHRQTRPPVAQRGLHREPGLKPKRRWR